MKNNKEVSDNKILILKEYELFPGKKDQIEKAYPGIRRLDTGRGEETEKVKIVWFRPDTESNKSVL